jgi:hypothetical protein
MDSWHYEFSHKFLWEKVFIKRKFRDRFGTRHGMLRVNCVYRQQQQQQQQQQPVALDVITRE